MARPARSEARATLIISGRILTLGGALRTGEVEALGLADGIILAAGALADIEPLADRTRNDGDSRRAPVPCRASPMHTCTWAWPHWLPRPSAWVSYPIVTRCGRPSPPHMRRASPRAMPTAGCWGMAGRSTSSVPWPTTLDLSCWRPGAPSRSGVTTTTLGGGAWPRSTGRASHAGRPSMPGLIRLDESGRPSGVLHESRGDAARPRIPATTRAARIAALEHYFGDPRRARRHGRP